VVLGVRGGFGLHQVLLHEEYNMVLFKYQFFIAESYTLPALVTRTPEDHQLANSRSRLRRERPVRVSQK